MYVAFIVASHLLALALAVYTTRRSGVPVEILLYAFLIDYAMRLGSIHVLHSAMASPRHSWLQALAPLVTRRPAPGQPSHPVREGHPAGPPARTGAYFLVIVAVAFFAFVLMHVNADKQLDLRPQAAVGDLLWALVIGSIYWINSLLTRTMVIHPAEPVTRNLGYNSKETTILTLAVITGGVVAAVRQEMGLGASGWTVMGPLLFFRFLYDLWASLAARPRGRAARTSE